MNGTRVQAEHWFFYSLYSIILFCLLGCVPEVKTVQPPGSVGPVTDFGILDISKAFKGSGKYTGYDASVLPASKVCLGNSVFGSSGIAVCQGASGGTNATAADVAAGTYFWNADGTSVEGTMTAKGPWDLTAAFPGSGYYSGISSSLVAADVCNSKSLLGAPGTAVCQSGSTVTPAAITNVLAGMEYWDSTGTKRTGTMTDRGGAWDLTSAFPGTGYYSGITSALVAADVCNSKNLLGSAGTAVCEVGTTVSAAAAGHIISGRECWDSAGAKLTGTVTDHGALNLDTTSIPVASAGYYSSISSSLTAATVCNTANIFGSAGTAVCNSLFGDLTASNAFRADNATIDLTNAAAVNARARAVLSDEASGNATYTGNHLLVPNPKYDTDGEGDDTGIGTTLRNYLVTVKGRPTKVCGLAGTTATRIADCLTQNGTKSVWEGKKYGQLGEGDWKLVTLYKAAAISGDACAGGMAGGCYEVWRDERTQLIWSDELNNNSNNYNWFQAAGYASSATTVAYTGKEGRAGVGTDCLDILSNAVVCQPATPISACAPAASINGLNGVATYQNPDGTGGTYDEGPAKGAIAGATALWRLPTYADWAAAYANGIAKVIPNMTPSSIYWTATSYSSDRNQAWVAGTSGLLFPGSRDQVYLVRCVGH